MHSLQFSIIFYKPLVNIPFFFFHEITIEEQVQSSNMGYCCGFDLHFPNVKYLFIYLLASFMSSLDKCLFNSFTHTFVSPVFFAIKF